VGDAVRDDARLPRPRASEDEDRAVSLKNGVALFGIEPRGEIHFIHTYVGRGFSRARRDAGAEAPAYSTVTLFARFRGWSTSHPRRTAMW